MPTGLNVLLVEDESEVRALVRTFLETLRCNVTVAASGEQALLAQRLRRSVFRVWRCC